MSVSHEERGGAGTDPKRMHNDSLLLTGPSKERDWLTTFTCRTVMRAPRQSFALDGYSRHPT